MTGEPSSILLYDMLLIFSPFDLNFLMLCCDCCISGTLHSQVLRIMLYNYTSTRKIWNFQLE